MRFGPILRPYPATRCRALELDDFRHFEAHFVFDDFTQRDIRLPLIGSVPDHRVAGAAVAGVELAHTSGNHVYEDVWIPDFFKGFFDKFSFHTLVLFGYQASGIV